MEEDEGVDPEVRRKEELRARMAKMSGGMGMPGMFGPPGIMALPGAAPMPPKKKKTSAQERRPSEPAEDEGLPASRAPSIPMTVAWPGMSARRSEEKPPVSEEHKTLGPQPEEDHDEEEEEEQVEEEDAGTAPPPRAPARK